MVSLASACSNTLVHIYTEGLTGEEVTELRRQVEGGGYRTRLNELPVPQAITSPTLVYSPYIRDLAVVEGVDDVLKSAGYNMKRTMESSGNHHYSRHHIGVFPKSWASIRQMETGAEADDDRVKLGGKEFTATCEDPDQDGTLILAGSGRFDLAFFRWTDTNELREDGASRGRWHLEGQLLNLTTSRVSAPFVLEREIENREQRRRVGVVTRRFEVIELFNVLKGSGLFRGCDFRYVGSLDYRVTGNP